MKLHEYQSKELLKKYGIATPDGALALNPQEAEEIAQKIGGTVVVKAQIHAGGRGKAGGIKLAKNPKEALKCAGEILGKKLMTIQTGAEGKVVNKVLVEKACERASELYLGLTIDRAKSRPVMIASSAGGMEIEEIARSSPEKILKETIDPAVGLKPYQARKIFFKLGLEGALLNQFVSFANSLYSVFIENDASLIEINPLVLTKDNKLMALDAKIDLDDNSLFRHKNLLEMRDLSEEDPFELEAKKYDLNYVSMDGNIGCMVNGAGLAMATMDLIKLHGGGPANFLDVGGSATKETVEEAFKIILRDPKVKSVLVNIFGGIMRCDVIAEGIASAVKELALHVPLIVRLQGTNVEKGCEIFEKSKLNITAIDDLAQAAKKAVEMAR